MAGSSRHTATLEATASGRRQADRIDQTLARDLEGEFEGPPRASVCATKAPDGVYGRLGAMLQTRRVLMAELKTLGAREYFSIESGLGAAGLPVRRDLIPLSCFGEELVDAVKAGFIATFSEDKAAVRLEYASRAGSDAETIIAFPIVRGGKVEAVMFAQSTRRRRWTPDEMALLRAAADCAWGAEGSFPSNSNAQRGVLQSCALLEAFDEAVLVLDPLRGAGGDVVDGLVLEVNEAFERHTGRKTRRGASFRECAPGLAGRLLASLDEAQKSGERQLFEVYDQCPGRWYGGYVNPISDGEQCAVLVVLSDVTQSRLAAETVRQREELMLGFGEAATEAMSLWDGESLECEYVNRAAEKVLRVEPANASSMSWSDLATPEDGERLREAIRQVRAGAATRLEHEAAGHVGSGGRLRTSVFPILDEAGLVKKIGAITHDITEEMRAQERLRTLLMELRHRTFNLLSVVGAVVERTLESSESLDDFSHRFSARLDALARVNDLLSWSPGSERVNLRQLILGELMAHGVVDETGQGEQVSLRGLSDVELCHPVAEAVSMAIHELATNAVKYGAFSAIGGCVEFSWGLEDGEGDKVLTLEWRERFASPILRRKREKNGFGNELIERALPAQLGGQTHYRVEYDGVLWRVRTPSCVSCLNSCPDRQAE